MKNQKEVYNSIQYLPCMVYLYTYIWLNFMVNVKVSIQCIYKYNIHQYTSHVDIYGNEAEEEIARGHVQPKGH